MDGLGNRRKLYGITPKFSLFLEQDEKGNWQKKNGVSDKGYWKLLIDRKMVNQETGEIIEQKKVQPKWDKQTLLDTMEDELHSPMRAAFDQTMEQVSNKILSGELTVSEEVKDELKRLQRHALRMESDRTRLQNEEIARQSEILGTLESFAKGKHSDRGLQEDEEDTGIKYSSREKIISMDINWVDDNESLKNQLVNASDRINEMNPVASLDYEKGKGETYYKQLVNILKKKFGNKIERVDGISFLFDEKGISNLRRYVSKRNESDAAVIASPYVLKRGIIIAGQKNHKGNGETSVTFAAPVEINGKVEHVAVSVMFARKDRVHGIRIVTPKGNQKEIKKEAETAKAGSAENGVESTNGNASLKNDTPRGEKSQAKKSDRSTGTGYIPQSAAEYTEMMEQRERERKLNDSVSTFYTDTTFELRRQFENDTYRGTNRGGASQRSLRHQTDLRNGKSKRRRNKRKHHRPELAGGPDADNR